MSTDEQQDGQQPTQKDDVKQPQHDRFFKSMFSEAAFFRKLLIWLVPFVVELLDLDKMECQKDSFIDDKLKAHYSDVIYKIPVRGTNENIVAFVLVEHKTSPDHWVMLQVLRYVVLIGLREYQLAIDEKRLADFMLPPVLPIIVYHGERDFKAAIRLGKLIRPIKGFEKYQLDFEAILLDLTNFDETTPPEDLELFAVLAIMQAVFRKDVADRIVRIYQKIKHKLGDSHYRNRWLKILRYAMTSSKYFSKENFIEVTSQMSDTEVLTISPFYKELLAEERNLWATDKVETLLLILTNRLGSVPQTVGNKLHTIHDIDVLGELTRVALDCDSLDEFVKVLEK